MKYKIFGFVILLGLFGWIVSGTIRAEKDTAMVGVDQDQLFAGAWFTLNSHLDLMLSLYDNSKVGWGIDYQNDGRKFKIASRWKDFEAAVDTEWGALHYAQDDAAGTANGSLNWNYRDLGVTGYYSTTEDSYRSGSVNARWEHLDWRTLVHTAYRNDKGELNNYRLKQGWETKAGKWSLELQDNMFSEGSNYIIGEGTELAWYSPLGSWQLAYGQFHETKSDWTEERWQVQWQKELVKQFDLNSLGFDTKLIDYIYGNSDNQQIGSLTGWWGYDLGLGNLKWKLENVWRTGITPFEFDYEDDYSCYTEVVYDWRDTYHSNFSIKYNLRESEWRTVHGLLETPLGKWTGSLTANYDLGADYGESELVYLALLSAPGNNFTVDQSFNHKFENLDTDLEWSMNFASGDNFRMKFAYDWEDKDLDNLLFEYCVVEVGKFTLTYDLDRPKVMLVYTWK